MPLLRRFLQRNARARFLTWAGVFILAIAAALGVWLYRQQQARPAPIHIALAGPLSGKEGSAGGEEMVRSVQMYFEKINQQGGVNGRPLKLLVFDDQQEPEVAKARAAEIGESPALLVLGHRSSEASAAGGSMYRQYKLAALTGTANTDSLTQENPYYFRLTYTRTMMFKVLSLYSQKILHTNKVSIIQYDNYGQALAKDFAPIFSDSGSIIKNVWTLDPKDMTQSIQNIVEALAADPDPGMVYFSMRAEDAAEALLVALRRRGLSPPILLAQPLSREGFAQRFERYEEEQSAPGFFTDGLYGAEPLLFDSASADAQEFANTYRARYGSLPSYVGIKFYETAILAVYAMRAANIQNVPSSRETDRAEIFQALSNLVNNRSRAPRGLTGPLYFNADRSLTSQPVRVAQLHMRKFMSAPEQFATVTNLDREDVQRELQAGNIVQLEGDYFWRQRVVYTGMDLTTLSRMDQKSANFTAEFYLWFRYTGDADITDIEFPGGTNSLPGQPLFDPAAPIESSTIDGLHYRLYQVRGQFKNPLDLRHYPFDQQHLTIRFQNTRTPSDRLVYVIDTFGLRLPRAHTTDGQQLATSLPLWKFVGTQYAQETFRTMSTEGNPHLFTTDNRVDYSGLSVTLTLQRRSLRFLVKNLLPLLLFTLAQYLTLYFPAHLIKDRPPVIVSILISGTVLLVSVHTQLPEIGYTVALEYMFYVFFGLSLFCILVSIVSDRLILRGHRITARRLDYAARVLYILVMLSTMLSYWTVFRHQIS